MGSKKSKAVSNKKLWRGNMNTGSRKWLVFVVGLVMVAIFFSVQVLVDRVRADTGTAAHIRFNEIVSDNRSEFKTEAGDAEDWIEIFNFGEEEVNIRDYLMYQESDVSKVFVFPDCVLGPGEYKVVFASGKFNNHAKEWSAPFKLSSAGGDTLKLVNNKNTPVDSVLLPEIKKGRCYARDEKGEWKTSVISTPNAENRISSKIDPEQKAASLGDLLIPQFSEVMTTNTLYPIGGGECCDYIELYNPSSEALDLSGWYLSDSEEDLKRWALPAMRMEAGTYVVIRCGGTDESDPLRSDIRLSKSGETLFLTHEDYGTVAKLKVPELQANKAYSYAEGKWKKSILPTPGRANTDDEAADYERSIYGDSNRVCISEMMLDPDDKGIAWLEIYNGTDTDADISDYGLSDNSARPRKWQFPTGTVVRAGQCITVYMPGKDETRVSGELNTDFSPAAAGGYLLTLSDPTGKILDMVSVPKQVEGISYGRIEGRMGFAYLIEPTKGSTNRGSSYSKFGGEVHFSLEGGAYGETSITLEITADPGAEIFYTTDGSTPSKNSIRYTGPLKLENSCMIRACTAGDDTMPSDVLSKTFILNHPTNLRTVCITGERKALIGSGGVLKTGKRTETPVNVEIYDYDGTMMINQTCALQLAGKSSRINYAQKGFKLKAKKAYGKGKFKAKLFTNREYTEYDSIVMRASGQDAFATHMRDSILTSLAADTSVMYQETELCAVFINGEYWGEYNMRENLNEDSICQFEGWEGDNDIIDVLSGSGMTRLQGSSDPYAKMLSFARNHSMKDDSNVEQLAQVLDLDNYIDFVCLMVYVDHEDLGNVVAYRNSNTDSKWRWAMYDQDLSYLNDKNSMRMWISDKGAIGSITTHDNTLFRCLIQNTKFRDRFLTRMGELLATTFSSRNVQGKIMERYELIKDEMAYSCKRWEVKYSTFQNKTTEMYQYAGTRTAKLIGYIQDTFKLSNDQVQHYFGEAIANETAYHNGQ